jgi:ribulose-5-phosphate 4-epimerase/fuculose-1-phosphate aldolase/putative sterol carrier protein
MTYEIEKKEIIYWASFLNQKGFAAARNGNVSFQVESDRILITAHNAYLGRLEEDEILLVDLEGNILEGGLELTAEKDLHLNIQRKFQDANVVFHAHPVYTTAFFHYFDTLDIFSFEAKIYLGEPKSVPQDRPAVAEIAPVLSALENNNIVVLKDHGVVSMGNDFKEAFGYIEMLEEQAKVNLLLQSDRTPGVIKKGISSDESTSSEMQERKFKLLSREHISRLIELVNDDKKIQNLGVKYALTFTVALKNTDTGKAVCFYHDKGNIVKTDDSPNADYVLMGPESTLKKFFNSEMDPLAASVQRKVGTEGDVGKMVQLYPVLVRTFKLWTEAPVE